MPWMMKAPVSNFQNGLPYLNIKHQWIRVKAVGGIVEQFSEFGINTCQAAFFSIYDINIWCKLNFNDTKSNFWDPFEEVIGKKISGK